MKLEILANFSSVKVIINLTGHLLIYSQFSLIQDMRVPECPLCNKPVPVRKGELPDRAVGEHIDRECHSDPAERLRRLSRRCSLATCRKIEVFSFPYSHNYTLLLLPG